MEGAVDFPKIHEHLISSANSSRNNELSISVFFSEYFYISFSAIGISSGTSKSRGTKETLKTLLVYLPLLFA